MCFKKDKGASSDIEDSYKNDHVPVGKDPRWQLYNNESSGKTGVGSRGEKTA